MNGTHAPTRKVQRRFPLEPRVTYTCSCNNFTITDTGGEAKLQWLRHLLAVEKPAEVTS